MGMTDSEIAAAALARLTAAYTSEAQGVGGAEDGGGGDFFAELARAENQGVRRVERLAGDIGYIDTTLVAEPADAAGMIGAAMTLVAHTRALILDLRDNRGGSRRGTAFWCGHLLPEGESAHGSFTPPIVPGTRYLDRPVYLLTGPTTFSGAEELARDLRARRRAVLVGERTRGGTGVAPDIAVPVADAFDVAYQHALTKLPPRPARLG